MLLKIQHREFWCIFTPASLLIHKLKQGPPCFIIRTWHTQTLCAPHSHMISKCVELITQQSKDGLDMPICQETNYVTNLSFLRIWKDKSNTIDKINDHLYCYVYVCVHVHYDLCVEIRRQLVKDCLLPPYGFWGLNCLTNPQMIISMVLLKLKNTEMRSQHLIVG